MPCRHVLPSSLRKTSPGRGKMSRKRQKGEQCHCAAMTEGVSRSPRRLRAGTLFLPLGDPLSSPKGQYPRKHKRRWRNLFRQLLCFRWHEYSPFVQTCQEFTSRFYVFHNTAKAVQAKVWQNFVSHSFLLPRRFPLFCGRNGVRPPFPSAASGSSWRAAQR